MKERTSKVEEVYNKLGRELKNVTIYDLIKLNEEGKINYKPNYQRNFVWNVVKCTNLIETILINGEVPPITMIKNQNEIRIIDGRQRYETLLRFYNNQFKLKESGLQKETLKALKGKSYEELPQNLRKIFLEYKFKVIMYTADISISENDLNLVERDLFMRYNYGMTALTRVDIARARYKYEFLTMNMEEILENNEELYHQCVEIFLPMNKRNKTTKRDAINLFLVNIRKMIAIPYIPIIGDKSVRFATNVIDRYYDTFIMNGLTNKEKEQKIEEFVKIFNKIYLTKQKLEKDNHYLKDNFIFFQTLYWMFSVLYKVYSDKFYQFNIDELCHYVENSGKKYFDSNENWTTENIEARHEYMKRYINEVLKLDISDYIEETKGNRKKTSFKRKEKISKDESWNEIGNEKQLTTYMDSMKISEIIQRIKENRLIIRAEYQRGEVTSKKKASRIIESIFLRVKLPPIYMYVQTGKDGLERYTVLDGQQRLISILKFIGEPITDENYNWIKTFKDKYELTGLRDFPDLEGHVYENGPNGIPDSKRNLIDDYVVEFIRINKEGNNNFNPIDMFLRLNQNPCPISVNSFEMWNSFDIINSINKIKEISKYSLFKQYRTKMEEAEMVTILAFMDYQEFYIENISKFLSIYVCTKNKDKRNEHNEIGIKITNKSRITNYLEKIEGEEKKEKEFLKSIDNVKDFVDKLKILSNEDDQILLKIFNPYVDKPRQAGKNDIYITWLMLQEMDLHIVKTYKNQILKDLGEVFKLMKNMPKNKDEKSFIDYMQKIAEKYAKYSKKLI